MNGVTMFTNNDYDGSSIQIISTSHCHQHISLHEHKLVYCSICDSVYCSICNKEWTPKWNWSATYIYEASPNTYSINTCDHKCP